MVAWSRCSEGGLPPSLVLPCPAVRMGSWYSCMANAKHEPRASSIMWNLSPIGPLITSCIFISHIFIFYIPFWLFIYLFFFFSHRCNFQYFGKVSGFSQKLSVRIQYCKILLNTALSMRVGLGNNYR